MPLNEPVMTIDLELKGLSPLISTGLGLTPKVIKSSTKLIFSSIARNSFIKFDATGPISFISNKSSSFAERKLVMLLKYNLTLYQILKLEVFYIVEKKKQPQ